MRIYLCLITAFVAVLAGSAHAELPAPSCEQMKAGYDQLTSAPISAEDGSLSIAVNALANNKLLAKDDTRTEHATQIDISEHLKKLSRLDALIWVFRRYDELEIALRQSCGFQDKDHKDIVLKNPKPVTPTCKQTGPLPKTLPK